MNWALASGPWTGRPQQILTKVVDGWKLSAKRKDPSTISFDISGYASEAATIQRRLTDLWLFCDSQVVTRGRVTQNDDALAGTHGAAVSAVDYRGVLSRRILWDTWILVRANTDPVEDAWAQIRDTQKEPGGDLGIVRGNIPTPVVTVPEMKHEAGSAVAAEIDAVSKLDPGFDWDITPVGETGLQADFWRPGRGRVTDVVLEYGIRGDAGRQDDSSVFGNSVRLPGGTDAANNQLPAIRRDAADIASRPEGRWELPVQDNNSTTVAAGGARADLELRNALNVLPAYTFALADGAWGGPSDFWLGDTVTLRIKSGRLLVDTQLPVEAIDVTSDPDSDIPKVDVTLGAYTYEQRQRLRLRAIDRQIGTLQRR